MANSNSPLLQTLLEAKKKKEQDPSELGVFNKFVQSITPQQVPQAAIPQPLVAKMPAPVDNPLDQVQAKLASLGLQPGNISKPAEQPATNKPKTYADYSKEYDSFGNPSPKPSSEILGNALGQSVQKGDLGGILGNALGYLSTPQGFKLLSAFGDPYQRSSVANQANQMVTAENEKLQNQIAQDEAKKKFLFQMKKQDEDAAKAAAIEAGKNKREAEKETNQEKLARLQHDADLAKQYEHDKAEADRFAHHESFLAQMMMMRNAQNAEKGNAAADMKYGAITDKGIQNLRKDKSFAGQREKYDKSKEILENLDSSPEVFRQLGGIQLIRGLGQNRINQMELRAVQSFGGTADKMKQAISDVIDGKYNPKNAHYISAFAKTMMSDAANEVNSKLDKDAERLHKAYPNIPLDRIKSSYELEKVEHPDGINQSNSSKSNDPLGLRS